MYSAPRVAIRTIGELFVTLGVLLLLFLIYQLWWSSVTADRAAQGVRDELVQQWDRELAQQPRPSSLPSSSLPTTGPSSSDSPTPAATSSPSPQPADAIVNATIEGKAFALMYIPRLRSQVWGTPIVKGIGDASLARGIGYYPDSAAPGANGNFAVAGHRTTHGEPFRSIDLLRAGDQVIVRTRDSWFTYKLSRDQLVRPRDTWVVDPVPRGFREGPILTMITCHPRWASTYRWIWWGTLVDSAPANQPPEAVR